MEQKLPLPPFNLQTAIQKVQMAEDAWNSRNPEQVCLAYTIDTEWCNRAEFINGRAEVKAFLTLKWQRSKTTSLKKSYGTFAKTG